MTSQCQDDAPSTMFVVVQACVYAGLVVSRMAFDPARHPFGIFLIKYTHGPAREVHRDYLATQQPDGYRTVWGVLSGFQRVVSECSRRLLQLALSRLPVTYARITVTSSVVGHLLGLLSRIRFGRSRALPALNRRYQSHVRILGAGHV